MSSANEYALAAGSGVALATLTAIEYTLYRQNRQTASGPRFRVGIMSQPVDEYPIRDVPLSGKERGDGMIVHEWNLLLATYGVKYLLDTYLTSATVVSTAVTINTRMHILATFKRYNA